MEYTTTAATATLTSTITKRQNQSNNNNNSNNSNNGNKKRQNQSNNSNSSNNQSNGIYLPRLDDGWARPYIHTRKTSKRRLTISSYAISTCSVVPCAMTTRSSVFGKYSRCCDNLISAPDVLFISANGGGGAEECAGGQIGSFS